MTRSAHTRGALVLLSAVLAAGIGGCKTKTNQVSINLFGFEESQLHDIATTTETNGSLFLVAYNPRHPSELEWINCPLEVTYNYYEANSRIEESLDIRNQGDLELALPLSAKRFSAFVGGGSSLEFRYITVGSYQVARPETIRIPNRDPDCKRATHYISTLSVGAFELRKQRQVEGGAGVDAKVIEVKGSGSHERESQTVLGDLEACRREESKGCRTPLQIMMKPLAKRQFDDEAVVMGSGSTPWPDEKSMPTVPEEGPSEGGTPQVPEDLDTSTAVAEAGFGLEVDESIWRPGHFMAIALEKLLGGAMEISRQMSYGIDGDASSIVGGFISAGGKIYLNRQLEGGTNYVIFGAGAVGSDIDILIIDAQGDVVAKDTSEDDVPIVSFTPPATATFSITLTSPADDFGVIGVMREDGYNVPPQLLHDVFQNLLDTGAGSSMMVSQQTGASGLIFHEANLSLYGTILLPGETIRQSNIDLKGLPTVFVAVGHDEKIDLNIEVTSPSGVVGKDDATDAVPVVVLGEPEEGVRHGFALEYKTGSDVTLGAALVLRVDP